MKRFLYLIPDLFLILFLILFCCSLFFLPESIKEKLGVFLGRIAFILLRKRREIALKNVERVFKAFEGEERLRIVRRSFERMGINFVELLSSFSLKGLKERFTIRGGEILSRLLREKKSIVLIGFHYSNWEIMGILSRLMNVKIVAIAKPLKNHFFLNRFLNYLRSKTGLYVLQDKGSLKHILSYIKEGVPVALLVDQREKRSKAVFVEFFGDKVPTTKVVGILSLRIEAYFVPVYLERLGFLRYRFVIAESLKMEKEGERELLIYRNTKKINEFLERLILENPEEWFWVHRRWSRRYKS